MFRSASKTASWSCRIPLPKLDAEPCTGIGLHNLDSRWQLITGHGIRIDRSGEIFSVCMSLLETPHEMKAVIIEDETAAAVNLQSILHRVAPAVEITAVLEGVEESVEWFGTHPQPDLVLMDIHLADGEAFRIFERVSLTAPVIFTTAYDRYALEAFKVDSIDYLLKPIKEEEVRRALEKLRRLSGLERSRYSERVERLAERANERQQVFLVRVRDKFIPLQRERIAYCYTSDERVTACTLDGEKYPLDKPLGNIADVVAGERFLPCQPPVHRRAAGRRRDRGLVRQPAGVASERRNTRTDRHLQGPGSRIQALAYVGSPCRLVGSPADFAR